ncbi:histidine kinase : PAS/PAC sensor hybrid histidine kinase OS=Cupriavidus pinatubonensis (strain JMP 134 / LMG 1197) GN=Reut_B4112 PE=4 SV=1: Response_reg [Gemmata massiliana]|uniref:Response regulatory domain-containing protein n=1 Tax=Gemmata massiliana TaxID=1210884 RepID=A0A6P2DJX5_9BACT|nr:response regulator [Gemmata massiliana]VTS03590.1 histidine kinase : PAS/PAC sensor hybrid histidine kinase OS=Cupriavidus pinatubonensis (strain JMP 134 / LMG 1197) GN=Reut_B4112 PE=4 SV=1: Response_reg [Gemmata massiliana]
MVDTFSAGDRALSVLIVDDERDAADSLAELISLYGYSTRVAYNGFVAVELASEVRPDVVFTDLAMPWMDGFSLGLWIREQVPHAVLVAVTGLTGPEIEVECHEAGFNYLLAKPLDMNAMANVLRQASERRTCSCAWASVG